MLRILILLVLIGAVIAGLLWAARRTRSPALPPQTGWALESDTGSFAAVLAVGPDRGPGHLSATPSQLVFASESGRVLVIERVDMTGVTVTHELPDRHTAAPLLAVSTDTEVYYFLVEQPEAWVRRLT